MRATNLHGIVGTAVASEEGSHVRFIATGAGVARLSPGKLRVEGQVVLAGRSSS